MQSRNEKKEMYINLERNELSVYKNGHEFSTRTTLAQNELVVCIMGQRCDRVWNIEKI